MLLRFSKSDSFSLSENTPSTFPAVIVVVAVVGVVAVEVVVS